MTLLRSLRGRHWLLLAASLAISFGVWRWARRILVPAYTRKVLASSRPVGNNSDLYPRWLGSRELFLHGRDPYSAEVTREIQTGFYGRPLDPNNPADPTAREAFVYPLYVAFLLAPVVTLPFSTAAEIFRGILLLAIAVSVPLWMYAIRLRPPWPVTVSAMLLAASTFPAVEEYFQQNLTALAVLFLAAAAAAAAHNWFALSGFFLALATVKPDTTGLMVLWFVLWAAAGWKIRRPLIFGFFGTMTVLVLAAEAISPHWIGGFFAGLRQYSRYDTDPSILSALSTPLLGKLFSLLLCGGLMVVGWRHRKAPAGSAGFAWSLACVAAVTLTVLPKLAAYNQLLLIPALLVMADTKVSGLIRRALVKAALACQIWQWLAASILALASLLVAGTRLEAAAEVPLFTLLALPPLAVFAVLAAALTLPVEATSA
ncbi:MAG: glycosyltransferase 87 family protein [Terriglobales bacterium]